MGGGMGPASACTHGSSKRAKLSCSTHAAASPLSSCGFQCPRCEHKETIAAAALPENTVELRSRQNKGKDGTNAAVCDMCKEDAAAERCEDCNKLFCTDCFQSGHAKGAARDHTHTDIEEHLTTLRAAACTSDSFIAITAAAATLAEPLAAAETAFRAVQGRINAVRQGATTTKAEIDAEFKPMLVSITERKNALKAAVDAECEERCVLLREQKAGLEHARDRMADGRELAGQMQAGATLAELQRYEQLLCDGLEAARTHGVRQNRVYRVFASVE